MNIGDLISSIAEGTVIAQFFQGDGWMRLAMICIGLLFVFLAIKKGFEPKTIDGKEGFYEFYLDKNVKSLIIDLRNNGGGIVDEALEIADYIIENNSTTRKTAIHFGISNATVSDWMNFALKKIDSRKFVKVEQILNKTAK